VDAHPDRRPLEADRPGPLGELLDRQGGVGGAAERVLGAVEAEDRDDPRAPQLLDPAAEALDLSTSTSTTPAASGRSSSAAGPTASVARRRASRRCSQRRPDGVGVGATGGAAGWGDAAGGTAAGGAASGGVVARRRGGGVAPGRRPCFSIR
jgi:hypothetical protein